MTDEELDAIKCNAAYHGTGINHLRADIKILIAELRATRAERDSLRRQLMDLETLNMMAHANEREACAQVADQVARDLRPVYRGAIPERIAAAIRARSDHHPSHPPDQI